MADRQFNPLGQESAPAGWTLPANLQLLLKQAYASFDGTGAAGSFQPCLEIVSDSGHTVGAYTASTVAAGASADVTFFPRVAGSGTSGGGATGAVAYLTGSTSSIPSGGSARVGFTSFFTTDSTVFGTATTAVASPPFHNTLGDTYLHGTALGFYLAFALTSWTSPANVEMNLSLDGSQWDLNLLGAVDQITEVFPATAPTFGSVGTSSFRMFYCDPGDTPLATSLICSNADTGAHTVTGATLAVYYLGTPTATLGSIF